MTRCLERSVSRLGGWTAIGSSIAPRAACFQYPSGKPASAANGGTVGFAASSAEQADAWHATGIANGGRTCEDPPGMREGAAGKLYLAYLRDPDGNKLCALHRMG